MTEHYITTVRKISTTERFPSIEILDFVLSKLLLPQLLQLLKAQFGMASEKHPPLQDLTIDNITPNVNRINSQSGNARLTYLMSRLVLHLHDFARETRLSTDEWMTTLNFLVACGQISTDVRHVSSRDHTTSLWLLSRLSGHV